MSDRYPTLLVAAGYAFAIWGLIFLLDLAYAAWQATGERKRDDTLAHRGAVGGGRLRADRDLDAAVLDGPCSGCACW